MNLFIPRVASKIMKIFWIGIIVITAIALVIFLYPKDAGGVCGYCNVTGIHKIEYDCIGFKFDYRENCPDCGTQIKCIGIIAGNKQCYGVPEGSTSMQDIEMPCT